jgi:hypothetical protein
MNNPRFWISCEGISLAALLSVTSIGSAEVVKFKADLKATDEVPPNDSKGAGKLEATYDSSLPRTGTTIGAFFPGSAGPWKWAMVAFPVKPE